MLFKQEDSSVLRINYLIIFYLIKTQVKVTIFMQNLTCIRALSCFNNLFLLFVNHNRISSQLWNILIYEALHSCFFFSSEVPSVCRLCSENAECLLDVSSQEFTCQCRSNYHGDGFNCTQVDCRTEQICDPNADCMYDPFELRHLCLCRNGFTGKFCNPGNRKHLK